MARDNQNIQPDEEQELFEIPDGGTADGEPEPDAESFRDADSIGGDISLESILAEYKGTAYIDGDKRTPSPVLQEKTDKIVMEVNSGKTAQAQISSETLKVREPDKEKTVPLPKLDDVLKAKNAEIQELKGNAAGTADVRLSEKNVVELQKLRRQSEDEEDAIAAEVSAAIEKQTELEEDTKKKARKVFGLFSRNKVRYDDDEYDEEPEEFPEPEPEPVIEDEVFEEPDFHVAAKRFAEGCNSYSMRSFVSLVLSVVMAILTLVFQSDVSLPFGIGNNKVLFTGILLIFLFVVMMLSLDKLKRGITDFFKKGPGLESLNLMSCLTTITAAIYSMVSQDTSTGMPYCVVSAFTLTFTLWGEKIYYKALTETIKTAMSVSSPCGVVAEVCDDLDKTVIKKASGRTAGFYNNLIQADVSETAYKFAAPILMVAAIALGFYASIGHELRQHILHNIAAVMAAAAPFSAMMTFAIPFNAVARRARKSGAAVAGWGGADELFHSDGASITDEDLFPTGTVSLGGIKIFEEVSPEKALRYTASLVIASNSGLTKLFSEHIYKQGMTLARVEDFACYEGGIGGTIRGERVIAGSAAFMNLMGIRIPTSLNMKNAIFTAVGKKLIAVFAVNYVPVKSVQNALVSVLRYRVKLFFAVRDFNITPVMLEQKYKVPVDDVEYIPIKDSYDISDATKHEAKRVSAILTREGLGPFVEAITGGRRLRTTSLVATIFSLISAVFGMLLMFMICWTGAYGAASAGNLLLYMLAMFFVVLVISGFAKFRQ